LRGGRRYRLLRGIVSLLVLRYLAEGEECGYGLRRRISGVLGEALPPGYIYVILKSLRGRGLLDAREGSRNGRRVVYYRITDSGMDFLLRHRGAVEAGRRAIEELTRFLEGRGGESARGYRDRRQTYWRRGARCAVPAGSPGRCAICGRPAAVRVPYANASFCEEHYPQWLERRIRRVADRYGMLDGVRRVAVAVSGGKDSVSLLHALAGLRGDYGFEIVGIHLDLGIGDYSRASAEAARRNFEMLGVEGRIVDLRARYGFSVPEAVRAVRRPACSTCGVVKRYALEEAAEDAGADALATGHNLDDAAQFVMMGYQSGDLEGLARLRPVIPAGRHYGVRSVKPLFLIYERDLAEYARIRGLPVAGAECPLRDRTSQGFIRRKLLEIEEGMPGFMLRLVQEFADGVQPALAERYLREEDVGTCRICGRPTSKGREICSFCAIRARALGTGAAPGATG
jgi:uncharacterized protein (TIGR00269 family)